MTKNALCAVLLLSLSLSVGCGSDDAAESEDPSAGRSGAGASASGEGGSGAGRDGGSDAGASETEGSFLALTYNVAGLPEGLSQSMPLLYTPLISPLLNGYDLVLVQESWFTPEDNPFAALGLRVYHELLIAAADHPYKSEPATHPLNMDPDRPDALLGDGLNYLSIFPFDEVERVRWETCVESEADCLALKGFSFTRMHLADDVEIDVYNLHMEAGGTPEDEASREGGLAQLLAFIEEHSEDRAVIVGGDFNLRTDGEPAMSQFQDFLDEGGLTDACYALDCDEPGSIDKFVFRSAGGVELSATRWSLESDVFQTADGMALSDHEPVAVRFEWALRE